MPELYTEHLQSDTKKLCEDLLREWCHSLIRFQIQGTNNPKLDGALICPACGKIHGRCFEAMYPFLCMAAIEGDKKWVDAAEKLFVWAEHTVSQKDGSFLNDIDSSWKGTTVFNVLQLADCLLLHPDLLSDKTKQAWTLRLKQAAEFLYHFDSLKDNNINYPISNALALYECWLILHDDRYKQKAKELADPSALPFSKNSLLYGEGVPREKRSARGCRPIDIGYNVEETLPALALYGSMTQNQEILDAAKKGLAAHLPFLLENGAWDNSFGTRNYKWSYWGSRTSDGCALGYLLLANENPDFAVAAHRNLTLLKECTLDGLLAGGPHYGLAHQAPCIHHTFTHAKVLAGILDRVPTIAPCPQRRLPRQRTEGIRYYPEIQSWTMTKGSMTATVTACDWEYLPGGHVGGGTLSLLHHEKGGTLLCAGMSRYTLKEPNNMQVPYQVRHECLAMRIESEIDGTVYSSIYDDSVQVKSEGDQITVQGTLKSPNHQPAPQRDLEYRFAYCLSANELSIQAEFHSGTLILPVISGSDEAVAINENGQKIAISKKRSTVIVESNYELRTPYGTERIFNLVPGMQALRLEIAPQNDQAVWIKIFSDE